MTKFIRLFTLSLKKEIAYKFSSLAQLVLPLLQVTISILVWGNIIGDSSGNIQYSMGEMIAYLVLAAYFGVLCGTEMVFKISTYIKKGTFSYLLLRPMNLLVYFFAEYMGRRFIPVIIGALLFIPFAMAGFVSPPTFPMVLLLFFNYILLFLVMSLLGLLSFWVVQMWPLKPIVSAVISLLGGSIFPLDLLPEHIYNVVRFNPLALAVFVNSKMLTGGVSRSEVFVYIIISFAWIAVLYLLHETLLRRGRRRYESMGV